MMFAAGCASTGAQERSPELPPLPRTVVVAPVLNLSGNSQVDALAVTDAVASEMVSFPGVTVIPVNNVLAALAETGRASVQSPPEACQLARDFGADGTVVVALTEYRPTDPPLVGMILQYYQAAGDGATPRVQVQRVFNAADNRTLVEMKEYGEDRDGGRSPYGWRKYAHSQELYVRYCSWSLIRSMERVLRAGMDPGLSSEGAHEHGSSNRNASQRPAPVRVPLPERI
jgi:hypothetical protein